MLGIMLISWNPKANEQEMVLWSIYSNRTFQVMKKLTLKWIKIIANRINFEKSNNVLIILNEDWDATVDRLIW
jgi:hypothetical protein